MENPIAAPLRQFRGAPLTCRAGVPRMLWERGPALGTLQLRSGVPDACLVIITQVVAPILGL